MKRAAIYTRVSSQEQTNGYSLGEQEAQAREYCENAGYKVTHVFTDAGFTGANINRPEFQKLLACCERKEFDIVVVWKINRLTRSIKDGLMIVEDYFSKNGISFKSLGEDFDTTTPMGQFGLSIAFSLGQLEREQIMERMKMGRLGRAKKGKATAWVRGLFGYDYCPSEGILLVNPVTSLIVKDIYDSYYNGASLSNIMMRLNLDGHIGKKYRWSISTVKYILQNPTFTGKIKHLDEYLPGRHEAIISPDFFEKVQREIVIRQQKYYEKNKPRPFKSKKLLSGLMRCGICDSSIESHFYPERGKATAFCKSRKTVYRIQKGIEGACDNIIFDLYELEKHVSDFIGKIQTKGIKSDINQTKNKIIELTSQKEKLDNKLIKLMDLYLLDKLPIEKLDLMNKDIQAQSKALEKKIFHLQSKKSPVNETILQMTRDFKDYSQEEKKFFANKIIDKIILLPDKIEVILSP